MPKRLKMVSRSSSVVTAFSLQMKSILAGGAASASGRSPIISRTTALRGVIKCWEGIRLHGFGSSAGMSEGGGERGRIFVAGNVDVRTHALRYGSMGWWPA